MIGSIAAGVSGKLAASTGRTVSYCYALAPLLVIGALLHKGLALQDRTSVVPYHAVHPEG